MRIPERWYLLCGSHLQKCIPELFEFPERLRDVVELVPLHVDVLQRLLHPGERVLLHGLDPVHPQVQSAGFQGGEAVGGKGLDVVVVLYESNGIH